MEATKPEYYIALWSPRVGPRSKRPFVGFLCGGTYEACEKRIGEQTSGDLSYGAIIRNTPPPCAEHMFS